MKQYSRRSFLSAVAGAAVPAWLANFHQLGAAHYNKVKITDIKTMMLQGPRSYTLVRIDTDAGVSGMAEAYGSPGLGIREEIQGVKETFIGKDPLQIDRLYTGYRYTDGSAHAQQRAMSGIEMALWDLAGKLLDVPTHVLLGGKFRDKVRLYDHSTPTQLLRQGRITRLGAAGERGSQRHHHAQVWPAAEPARRRPGPRPVEPHAFDRRGSPYPPRL